MSDLMRGRSFPQLVQWMKAEYGAKEKIFGVDRFYRAEKAQAELFGRKLENVVGPAAGPHTQLAQNLAAAYAAGGRFFELKTVQIMDGEELAACIAKPCINADDECYNCEWSTELTVSEAFEEYVKGWFLLAVMAVEYGFGSPDGYQFNMSVGYDLEGIRSSKIDRFIEQLKDASGTEIFCSCRDWLLEHLDEFEHLSREDVEAIRPDICSSVTLSTLHGCPAGEIERIAGYLMEEKGLNTFLKCNPTLLGYDYAKETLEMLGYDSVVFDEHHFMEDLSYKDAVPMLQRLLEKAERLGLEFGVKLTNTFPVETAHGELPSEEMYLSGKALFPLTMAVAAKLSADFPETLRMSYSGGADESNVKEIIEAGIWPVTVSSILLKPAGYKNLVKIAEKADGAGHEENGTLCFHGVSPEKTKAMAQEARSSEHYRKGKKAVTGKRALLEERRNIREIDCRKVCATCVNVCPNRANTVVELTDGRKILHLDDLCNECGNCISFCPFGNIPYREKFTLFGSEQMFDNSTNEGFCVSDGKILVREKEKTEQLELSEIRRRAEEENWQAGELILAVLEKENWLIG